MSNDYQNNRKKLGALLKTEPKTPIQEVRPVADAFAASPPKPVAQKEAHVNFWVPEGLMERLKVHAAKSKKSIKQIGIEALEQHLAGQK